MVTADRELSHAENSPSPLLISHPSTALYRSYYPFPSKAFILSDFNLFLHPFLPTFFSLARSIHQSICMPPQTEAAKTSDIQHMCNCGSPSHAVLFLQHVHSQNTNTEHAVKKSQRFVYIRVGEKKLEVSPSGESKGDWHTGHQSDRLMSWSHLNIAVENKCCVNTMQSVLKPKHQILPPRSHYVYWLSHNPWTD